MLSGRTWKSVALARIYKQKLPNGATVVGFKLALRPSRSGRYTYRVYKGATASNVAGSGVPRAQPQVRAARRAGGVVRCGSRP